MIILPTENLPAVNSSILNVDRADFVLIGGFLGAGKTTATRAATDFFLANGRTVGLVTNDQGVGLIDTAQSAAEAPGLGGGRMAIAEITGGCFCCRADELVDKLRGMLAGGNFPVILAEPVGSCTDLVATILGPLREVYKLPLRVAPMSVLLDARRLADMYFGKAGKSAGFSRDVRYIYLKQMEEAEVLVLNKADLLSAKELTKVQQKLAVDWPGKKVFTVSVAQGYELEEWFSWIAGNDAGNERTMDVDYVQYGVGEALLGWYNAELGWKGEAVDGDGWLVELARGIQRELEAAGVELAHFKMSFHDGAGNLGVVNAVRNGSPAEISRRFGGVAREGTFLVNLRAEGDPAVLQAVVRARLGIMSGDLVWKDEAAFRPGQPKPVHRAVRE